MTRVGARPLRWPIAAALLLASCSGSAGTPAADGSDDRPAPEGETAPTVTTGDVEDTSPVQSAEAPTTDEPIIGSAAADLDAPVETSDPTVISRRTDGIDVLVLPDGVELPDGYSQAAVPVDAFAASELVTQPADATAPPLEPVQIPGLPFEITDGLIEVTLSIRSCRLVAVWALPHPDRIVVGYEEYPELTCVTPVEHVITFEVPDAGKNSEGTWDYAVAPPVMPLRKVGPSD